MVMQAGATVAGLEDRQRVHRRHDWGLCANQISEALHWN